LTLGGTLVLTLGDVTSGLGFTPYKESNPDNFTDNLGVVVSLTTNGTSGPSTLTAGVLNVPSYATAPNGVTSIVAGDGIVIDTSTGDVTVSQAAGGSRYIVPTQVTLSIGSVIDLSDTYYNASYLVRLNWANASGVATVNLPTAATSVNRVFRFVSQLGFSQGTTVNITPSGLEKIDGNNTSYAITTDYAAVEIWSDGIEWFIIQEKA
jgi:hypothetical protein